MRSAKEQLAAWGKCLFIQELFLFGSRVNMRTSSLVVSTN